MDHKKAKTSYKLSYKLLSILFILSISFVLVLSACKQDTPQDKIDIGPEPTQNQEVIEQEQQEITEEEETEEDKEQEPAEKQEQEQEEAEEEAEEEEPQTVTIKVYYTDSQVQHLVSEERIISTAHKYLSAFMELKKPPLQPGYMNLVPEETKVNRVSFNDGNIDLDLSSEFVDKRFVSDTVDVLLVHSIVNTLTEFDEVNTVTFYIDGEQLKILGQLDIKGPQYRDTSWIKNN